MERSQPKAFHVIEIDAESSSTVLTERGEVGAPWLSLDVPGDVITTTTTNDCAAIVGRKLWPHLVRNVPKGHGFRSTFAALEVGDCVIAELNYESMVEIDAGVMDGIYLATLCLNGAAETRSGTRRAASVPGSIIISSPNRAARYAIGEGSRNIAVRIPRAKLEAQARELFYYDGSRPIEFDMESSICSAFGKAFALLVQHICVLATTVPSALGCSRISSGYSNMLADTLLGLHSHNYSGRRLDRGLGDAPQHLRRAVNYIETMLHEISSVEQVCTYVSVTERCLQKSFQRYLRLSPAAFLRERRLHRLRELLLTADRGQSIMELMLSIGIEQSGRYSGYYLQRFGETPSATRRKAQTRDRRLPLPTLSHRPGG
jgi:AraC-like DNA-binding protein